MLSKSNFLLAGLIATGTALAQVPPPPPAGAPVQPGAAVQPNDPAALAQKVKQEGYLEPKINGERLAELYSELTGRRVTVSNAAIAAEFRFVQQGPITFGEAAELLKIAAVMEGFVFIPSGHNHDRLVYSQSIAQVGDQPVPTVLDAADLPEGEQVVTYVMPLKHIKPDEVVRTFTAVVKQFGSFGSVAAVPNAASVIITEKSSLIRRLIELQDVIDVPKSDVATKFIRVQYADVQELSEILNEILNTQQQQQSTAGVQRVQSGAPATPVNVPPGGAGAAAALGLAGAEGGGGAGEDVPIQIVPNARTNQIFAMGRPVDLVFVESLVAGFDTPTDTRNYLRRKLKFLAVADFLPVAEQALQRAFGGSSTQGGATGGAAGGGGRSGANFGGGGGNTSRNNQSSSRGGSSGGRSSGGFNTNQGGGSSFGGGGSSFGGGGGGSSFGGGSTGGGGNGSTLVNNAPTAQLIGRTLLVADNITNSLVVQGPPASLEIVNQLLDEIDVKAEQVMISCVFGQLTLGDDLSYGLDFLKEVSKGFGGRGGSGTGPILPVNGDAFDPGDLLGGAGLSLYGKIGPYLNVYLEALQSSNKFNIVARPTVFMANNQTGMIRSGQQIAVPTSTYNGGSTGSNTNIDYRDVVLDLQVTPLVNSPDEVTLQISVLNDEIIGSQEIDGVGTVPTISTRSLETTVTVPNNETIVLGGLITTRNNQERSGIPLLSQIPYIGGLFGTTENEVDREELLVFIQPKIVNDKASLYEGQADIDSRYKFDDENRENIDGPGLLPTRGALDKPAISGKAANGVVVPVEEAPTPRRVSSRPKGFVKTR